MKIMFNILFIINTKKNIIYYLFKLIDFYYIYIFCYIKFLSIEICIKIKYL